MTQHTTNTKDALRDMVWRRLLAARVVPPDSYGKIPDYQHAARATELLAGLPAWQQASAVFANPDYAQRHARMRALHDGKTLYIAIPNMAAPKPFTRLDPGIIDSPSKVLTAQEATRVGTPVGTADMEHVDVFVCGSVAVNPSGARLGKGAGYSDLEVALLHEDGRVTDDTVTITLVHPLQVIDEDIPEAPYDHAVDYIVTPTHVIPCPARRPLPGLMWNALPAETIAAIPVLKARRP